MLRDRHAAARNRLACLTAQQSAANAQREALAALTTPANPADAWARFERFHRQIELSHAESLAYVELEANAECSLETQFDERATQRAIEEELARLKSERPPAGE